MDDYDSYLFFSESMEPTCSLDNYEIQEKIGEGAFGEVFKAVDKTTQEYFAIKRIRIKYTNHFTIMLAREISILRSVQHDNIVCLKNVCQPSTAECRFKMKFLVFEYCDNDLSTIIMSMDLIDSTRRSLMMQLLKGVAYLHS